MPIKNRKKRNDYMKNYMRELRKIERKIIRDARVRMGVSTRVRKTQKKRKRKKK